MGYFGSIVLATAAFLIRFCQCRTGVMVLSRLNWCTCYLFIFFGSTDPLILVNSVMWFGFITSLKLVISIDVDWMVKCLSTHHI